MEGYKFAELTSEERSKLWDQFYEEVETGIDLDYTTDIIAENLVNIVKGERGHIILDKVG